MSKVKEKPVKETWEIKDRIYYLKNDKSPLTLTIPSKHIKKILHYFGVQVLMKSKANKEN